MRLISAKERADQEEVELSYHLGHFDAFGNCLWIPKRFDVEGFYWGLYKDHAGRPDHGGDEDYLRSGSGLCQLDPYEREDGTYSTHKQRGWAR